MLGQIRRSGRERSDRRVARRLAVSPTEALAPQGFARLVGPLTPLPRALTPHGAAPFGTQVVRDLGNK
jgi:hypothetical protein